MRKILNLFFQGIMPRKLILLLDLAIVGICFIFAFILKYGFMSFPKTVSFWGPMLLLWIFIHAVFFIVFKTYARIIRYSTFIDLSKVAIASTISFLVFAAVEYILVLNQVISGISATVVVISWVLSVFALSILRIVTKRLYDELHKHSTNIQNVFIYGIKEGGLDIAKLITSYTNSRYRLKGFIADEIQNELTGKKILGETIYKRDNNLLQIIKKNNVDAIIVSPETNKLLSNDLAWVDQMLESDIKFLSINALDEVGRGEIKEQIQSIKIEDLLQREPIKLDLKNISRQLNGKRILITGAAGSIGSEIVRQVLNFYPQNLILIDQAETPLHDVRLETTNNTNNVEIETIIADIRDVKRLDFIFKTYKPQYIFHAAAYKHVPMMEDNVSESIQNNVQGTINLANLSVKYDVEKFVMVSTDKAVNPTNVMGCSKRLCEIYVQSLDSKLKKEGKKCPQFITTRFGNVLGSNGSVIPLFKNQIENGGPVTVTHPDIVRYFMTIPEACQLVLEAGCMGSGGEIFVFDMGKPVKIMDLAKRMILLSGKHDIKIQITGLREGEKLYEEVLNDKETVMPTIHEKVKIASVRQYNFNEIAPQFTTLIESTANFDDMKTVALMKSIVPEYKSQNSKFQVLDKNE